MENATSSADSESLKRFPSSARVRHGRAAEPPSPKPLTLLVIQGTKQRPSQTQRVLALPVIRQGPIRENRFAPFPQTPNPFSSLQEARKKQRPSQTQRVLAPPVKQETLIMDMHSIVNKQDTVFQQAVLRKQRNNAFKINTLFKTSKLVHLKIRRALLLGSWA